MDYKIKTTTEMLFKLWNPESTSLGDMMFKPKPKCNGGAPYVSIIEDHGSVRVPDVFADDIKYTGPSVVSLVEQCKKCPGALHFEGSIDGNPMKSQYQKLSDDYERLKERFREMCVNEQRLSRKNNELHHTIQEQEIVNEHNNHRINSLIEDNRKLRAQVENNTSNTVELLTILDMHDLLDQYFEKQLEIITLNEKDYDFNMYMNCTNYILRRIDLLEQTRKLYVSFLEGDKTDKSNYGRILGNLHCNICNLQ